MITAYKLGFCALSAPTGKCFRYWRRWCSSLASHWFRPHSWTFTYPTLTKPVPDDSAGLAGVVFPNAHSRLQLVEQLDELLVDHALRVPFPLTRIMSAVPSRMALVTIC
jgi:hypothetical protein